MPQFITIQSNQYKATISTLGAELKSVVSLKGTEFMWQADADIWPRTAPVLFPIVGKVKDDKIKVNEVTYGISQHGFARDKKFTVVEQSDTHVKMQLLYDDETLQKYPFDFKLILSYAWVNDTLECAYEVYNLGAGDLPFSIGAHPGFAIHEGHFEQYCVRFEQAETANRLLMENGLFTGESEPFLQQQQQIDLSASVFDQDALVFKQLRSSWVELAHKQKPYAVKMSISGFPYFAIWAKKGTQRFVCLEPWYGIADSVNGHKSLSSKEGIQMLKPHEVFTANYQLTFSE